MTAPFPASPSSALPLRLTVLFSTLLAVLVVWMSREIPGFDYAMLMDDDTNILFNLHLGAIDAARVKWMFTDIHYVARYLPLGWFSFSLFGTATDLSPLGCHLASIGFHALNAIFVLLCLSRVARRFGVAGSATDQVLCAGVGAMLWALHPLRVESIAWPSGLLYVQGGFFALVTTYARIRELELRAINAQKGGVWFALGAVAFLVSLLTYPVALFLPAVIVLLDRAWLKNATGEAVAKSRRWLMGEAALLLLFSALALGITIVARQVPIQHWVPPPTLAEFGLMERAFQAAYVWASYPWRTFFPVHLTPVMEALFEVRLSDVRIWAALPTLLVISFLAWRWRKTAVFFGVCWLGYLVWMVPVLGLSEHPHTAGDRYSYLVSILFSVMLMLGVLRLRAENARRAVLALGAVAAFVCAGLSLQQARIWHDPITMHRHVLAHLKDPDLRNITLIRMAKLQFLAGDVRVAREAAWAIYQKAPGIGGVVRTWREMAPAQPLSPEVAAQPLQEWGAVPLALLHENIAQEQFAQGRASDALAHLNLALARAPATLEIRFRRLLVYAALGRSREALHDWLVLEARATSRVPGPGAMNFAATQIAQQLRAAGDERLASALERRAAGAGGITGAPPPAR